MMYGTNLLSSSDVLQRISVREIYERVRQPEEGILLKLHRCWALKEIDMKKYNLQKRGLPYFVCGNFSPSVRKTENFSSIDYFVLDIDHISEKELSVISLRTKLENDPRVMLTFISPGQDGLKVLFRFRDPCYDAGIYSIFYKKFAESFSEEYALDQTIDKSTCDVTRACFLSYDTAAYFNPDAFPIEIGSFIELDNPYGLFEEQKCLKKDGRDSKLQIVDHSSQAGASSSNSATDLSLISGPDVEALQHIKQTLLQRSKPQKAEIPVYVPKELDAIIGNVVLSVENMGISVKEVKDIQYGKKIRSNVGMLLGETNLFYGKKGFKVVQSPKKGVNLELNQIVADVIQRCIDESTFSAMSGLDQGEAFLGDVCMDSENPKIMEGGGDNET